jgi:hypothetical protein
MPKRILIFLFWLAAVCLLPLSAQAATLYLSPSSGSHETDSDFNVTLGVNSPDQAINVVSATVTFPTNLLEVRSINKAAVFSLCPVQPIYSNSSGSIQFACGAPNGTSSTSVITITFRGKAAGAASVTLGSASVLANDGLGTNVLTGSGSGSYTITEPAPPPPEKPLPLAPVISSTTHPDQNLWYTSADPSFSWSLQSGVTAFSYSLDDQERKTPDTVSEGSANSKNFTAVGDGTWYFHVRAQNENGWGPAAHFRIRIYNAPPLPFEIKSLDGNPTSVRTPRLSFSTTDATSGVHHYSLKINDGVAIEINADATEPYTLSELANGTYVLEATAYDYAGNKVVSSITLTVKSAAPTNANTNTNTEPEPGETEIINPIIPETITRVLPKAVQELVKTINKTVQNIRQNKTFIEVVKNIVQPTTTTAAIVAATGVAATTTGLELFNMIYLFFRFGYFWLIPVSLGKKRKPWGVVFDSTTGKPVRRAIVRLFSKEFNKLRESQITDADGRFGFLVDPGEYFVAVERQGFMFPSKILKSSTISLYDNIYRGNIFTVKERREGALNLNIPIDPEIREVAKERLAWLRFLNILGVVLERLNMPLLIGGVLVSWLAAVIQPTLFNNIILLFYGLLIILKGIILRRLQRSWGVVTDHLTGSPIQYAVIRIYNMATGAVAATRVTSGQGQFTALVAPGQYYTVVAKAGYHTFQSKPVDIRKKHGLIKMAVQLMPLMPTNMAPGSVINLEPMGDHNAAVHADQQAKSLEYRPAKNPASPFALPPLIDVMGKSSPKKAKSSEKKPDKGKK